MDDLPSAPLRTSVAADATSVVGDEIDGGSDVIAVKDTHSSTSFVHADKSNFKNYKSDVTELKGRQDFSVTEQTLSHAPNFKINAHPNHYNSSVTTSKYSSKPAVKAPPYHKSSVGDMNEASSSTDTRDVIKSRDTIQSHDVSMSSWCVDELSDVEDSISCVGMKQLMANSNNTGASTTQPATQPTAQLSHPRVNGSSVATTQHQFKAIEPATQFTSSNYDVMTNYSSAKRRDSVGSDSTDLILGDAENLVTHLMLPAGSVGSGVGSSKEPKFNSSLPPVKEYSMSMQNLSTSSAVYERHHQQNSVAVHGHDTSSLYSHQQSTGKISWQCIFKIIRCSQLVLVYFFRI